MIYFLKIYRLLIIFTVFFCQLAAAQQVSDSAYASTLLHIYDHPDMAIDLGERMYNSSHSSPKKKIDGLLLLSNAYSAKRDYEKSIDYALKARVISQESKNARSEIAILNKIASQYHQMGINDKALQFLDDSDQIIAVFPYKDSVRMSAANNNGVRGFIYRDQLNCDIAITYFNRAINEYESDLKNPSTIPNMSVITYNKGNCFIRLQQMDSARATLNTSLTLAQQAGAQSLQAFSRKGLAEVYTLSGEYERAISELNTALTLSKTVGDLVLNTGLYKGLSDNYLAIDNWEQYQHFYSLYLEADAKNRNEELKSISTSLTTHSKEIQEQTEQITNTYYIGIGFCVLGALLLLVWIVWGQLSFQKTFKDLRSKITFSNPKGSH